jgi:hypothetical protein
VETSRRASLKRNGCSVLMTAGKNDFAFGWGCTQVILQIDQDSFHYFSSIADSIQSPAMPPNTSFE